MADNKMKLSGLNIDIADDGGYSIRASYESDKKDSQMGGGYDSKEFVATDLSGLMDKITELLGDRKKAKKKDALSAFLEH